MKLTVLKSAVAELGPGVTITFRLVDAGRIGHVVEIEIRTSPSSSLVFFTKKCPDLSTAEALFDEGTTNVGAFVGWCQEASELPLA